MRYDLEPALGAQIDARREVAVIASKVGLALHRYGGDGVAVLLDEVGQILTELRTQPGAYLVRR
jgi:hypothetical protein